MSGRRADRKALHEARARVADARLRHRAVDALEQARALGLGHSGRRRKVSARRLVAISLQRGAAAEDHGRNGRQHRSSAGRQFLGQEQDRIAIAPGQALGRRLAPGSQR